MNIENPPPVKSISAGHNPFNIDPVDAVFNKIEEESKDDLFRDLRGLLIFGKVLGLLPYKGIFGHSSAYLKFRYASSTSFISYVILVILFINAFFEFVRSVTASKKNAFEVAQSIRYIFYQIWGAFIYLNFIIRSQSFLDIFHAWKSTSVFYSKPDTKLKRDIRLIAVVILVSAVLENATLHILFSVEYANDTSKGYPRPNGNLSFPEAYYKGFHKSWWYYISYNPVVAIIAFIQHKWTLFAWNYIDILIAVLGRALYYKFKILCESSKEVLIKRDQSQFIKNVMENNPIEKQGWLQMTRDHHAICELLEVFENFLSPVLFVSYMINIYYVCMQVTVGKLKLITKMKYSESIRAEVFEVLKANKLTQKFKNSVKCGPSPEAAIKDDLFNRTRSFFIIGRLLGIVPFSGTFQNSYSNLNFKIISIPCLTSIGITVLLIINWILEIVQAVRVKKENAVEIAMAVKSPIFYGYGVFVYLFFLLRARRIIDLFRTWVKVHTHYYLPDKNLSKDVLLLCCIVLTSAFLENGLLHLKYFQKFDNLNDLVMFGYNEQLGTLNKRSSILEIYYRRSHFDRSGVLGYNELYAILVFISNKWTLFSWNYIDLLLGLCGRAINFKFKSLHEITKAELTSSRKSSNHIKKKGKEPWLHIVKDHEILCNLLREFQKVLSPLIFISYAINVFYVCMQIYMGLHTEDSGPASIIHSIYAPWSLLHLALRIYIVSISLARVNVFAHKIMDVINECPIEFYDKNISRLDRRVTTGPKIGFSGLGCFTVTKPFILQIIGVIFTFEIVLLQGSSAVNGSHVVIMEHSLRTKISDSETDKSVFNYGNSYSSGSEKMSKIKVESEENDLFKDLRGFFILGKIIGLIPFSGVMGNSSTQLTFRRKSVPSIISHIILGILIFNAVLGVVDSIKATKRNALEIAHYITFLRHGEEFLNIFYRWRSTHIVYSKKDQTLRRDMLIISVAIMASAVLENGVLHLEYIKELDFVNGRYNSNTTDNLTTLESFYWRSHYHWGKLLGYNWFLAVLAFVQHKWILYSWNYMDILIAVFARAIYFQFKSLYKVAKEKVLITHNSRLDNTHDDSLLGREAWTQIVQDHKKLCQLLELLENFFSPLVFGSYAINMYYICMQLLDGLTSEISSKSIVHSIYAPWSFLHLIMRTFTVSICCARINVYAHQIRCIFQECPVEYYKPEVSRLDKRVTSGPDIGFSGLGCFVVTKPFMLSILSVIFTFEIVLLQSVPSAAPPTIAAALSSQFLVFFCKVKELDAISIREEMEFSSAYKKSKDKISKSCATFKYEAFHVILGKPETEQPDDLFKSLKFFLIVGRIIGVIPYSGVFKKSYAQLHFCPRSAAAIQSFIIFMALVLNLTLGITDTVRLPKRNALEIATSVRATIQFMWSCLIYLNFLLRGKKFLALFFYWTKTSVFYGMKDRYLQRDATLITLLILTSAICENGVLHLEYVKALDDISGRRFGNFTDNMSALETYYRRSHGYWALTLGYHEIFAVLAFLQHKCMLYSCNFMDIMLAVFSRAIYFKFKMLYRLANEHLAKPLRNGVSLSKSSKMMNRHAWVQLAQDHKKLCDLLQQFENFFSPLVFGSYAVNIYYICIQLFDGLTVNISSSSLVHSIYAPWSFLHIIMRMYIVSICAARINMYAHQIRNVLQECPVEYYNAEIARIDKKVTTGPEIGLTGLGCFVVTKPFILRIISVVFTFEIVLLQGAPPSTTGTEC
ncbi:Gustatory receptor for sugar taste 64a [Orchesella cincta]|uniref:Gustatory receptor for sugar taste 64a n=1 Tax=Orchesella cincta TaxID=48709 RepID=A0A1D2M9S7_ORCCI|nr:Gustatory receptor for sugar taste 64a [Orchesella cincta]